MDFKKIYGDRKKVPPLPISFTEIKELLNDEFPNINNFGAFSMSFLAKYPEYYSYINSDKFMPWSKKFSEKIYCIINDIQKDPKLNFKGFTKGYSKYGKDFRFHRKAEARKRIDDSEIYDINNTVSKLKENVQILQDSGLSINNLYQSFIRLDPALIKSVETHTKQYEHIKFSNRVFLLLNGEPEAEKPYIKPVFFSLEKGYDMRFSTQNGTSKPEQEMFEWLHEFVSDLKKDRKVLDGKEIDMYSPTYKIGVEFDGIYWHRYDRVGDKKMLLKRQEAYSKGVKLINILETEWIHKKEIVKSLLLSKFNIFEEKIFARQCDVREIDSRTCIDFLEDNHLQGKDNSKYKFGLYHGDDLVSVMTFGKRGISKSKDIELIRFCNKRNTQIIGGASKLFKHFIRTHNPTKIISYANARTSDGDLYQKMGFVLKHHSDPNYWYFKPESPKKIKLKHRSGFQKHRLIGILENFDPTKTEWENMKDHGYHKIYDCGNLVFEYITQTKNSDPRKITIDTK
jgi:hypothetical protein